MNIPKKLEEKRMRCEVVYVMFALFTVSVTSTGMGSSSFQYEFKDRVQCENAIKVMKNRFEKAAEDSKTSEGE